MEMLIVIAIIAVLIAVAIPVFASQLEKAREATDLANVRSAYAQVSTEALLGDSETTVKYSLQGTTQGRYLTGGVPPVRFSM
jgi:type II secretory pathway pseudopilin PulG